MLRSRKTRREEPLEPVSGRPGRRTRRQQGAGGDPEQEALLADSVGLALLVVLDTLAAGRAARVRAARHVRRALRRDRRHRGPLPDRDQTARQPGPPPGAGTAAVPGADLARQREVVNAFFAASRGGDFDALLEVLDPDIEVRADHVALPAGASHWPRGAAAVARAALGFARTARFAQPALVNGAVGAVVVPHGRPLSVMTFTVARGQIAGIEIIADPARLRELDLAVLDD